MTTAIRKQDWEFCELVDGECETVDIQFETERTAILAAQAHANRSGNVCHVTTSIAVIVGDHVEDRETVEGAEAIEVRPQVAGAVRHHFYSHSVVRIAAYTKADGTVFSIPHRPVVSEERLAAYRELGAAQVTLTGAGEDAYGRPGQVLVGFKL
jgi:hypothetical protein